MKPFVRDLADYFFTTVPESCRRAQAAQVRFRIRTLAPALAVLTLGWIPLDLVGLTRAEFAVILPLRLALAAGLFLLAWSVRRWPASWSVQALVWMQALAFGAMQLGLSAHEGVLRVGYGLIPFVVAAQLAAFPLTWNRILAAALAPLALLLVPLASGMRSADDLFWGELWLLGLLALVAAWSGQTQLRLLTDLLGARRDAAHDMLTGLANRRRAEERLAAELARARRLHTPLSVLLLDLDHFKLINDRWGHAAGDQVLVATADALQGSLRGADLATRYGGEEFLAILPDTGPEAALEVAERIRTEIEGLEVPANGDTLRATTSIGIASLVGEETADALVARADAALYQAKQAGRNRCVAATGASPSPPGVMP